MLFRLPVHAIYARSIRRPLARDVWIDRPVGGLGEGLAFRGITGVV